MELLFKYYPLRLKYIFEGTEFSSDRKAVSGLLTIIYYFLFFYFFNFVLTLQYCIGFAKYRNESASGIHVFPILNPPPSSLPVPFPTVTMDGGIFNIQSSSVAQSCLTLYNPMDSAHQASLSITNSWSLLKLMSIMSVMPSNHLILCRPLLPRSILYAKVKHMVVCFSRIN